MAADDGLFATSSIANRNETHINSAPLNYDMKKEKHDIGRGGYVHLDTQPDFDEAVEYHEVDSLPQTMTLQDMEREMIKKTLEKYRGKRKPAAKELKISERTLYRKIKEYGIE